MAQQIPQRVHWPVAVGLGLILTHTFVRVAFDWWDQEVWRVGHSLVLIGLWGALASCVGFVRVARWVWLRGAYCMALLVLLAAPLQDVDSAWDVPLFRQLAILVTVVMFSLLALIPRWAFRRLWDLDQAYRAKPVAMTRWRFRRALSICLPLSGMIHLVRGAVDAGVTPMWEAWPERGGDQRSVFIVEMVAQATSVSLLCVWWLRFLLLQRRERAASRPIYGHE